jgi:chaperonin GroEL
LLSGVVDPAKVAKNSLRFAVSTAGVILLTETLIGNAPDEEEEKK